MIEGRFPASPDGIVGRDLIARMREHAVRHGAEIAEERVGVAQP
jgi:thioredoxin reductase (NADPH)